MRRALFLTLIGLFLWFSTPCGAETASVTLQWDAVTHNTDGTALTTLAGYYVYQGLQSGVYDVRVHVLGSSTVIEGLRPGATYFFAVSTSDQDGSESARSAEISITIGETPPPAMTALITWNNPDALATSIEVHRSMDDDQQFILTGTVDATATSFTDAALVVGHRYCYQVVAVNHVGSTPSEVACAAPPPGARTGVTSTIIWP